MARNRDSIFLKNVQIFGIGQRRFSNVNLKYQASP